MQIQGNWKEECTALEELLHVADNFDLIRRDIKLGGRAASFFFVDGFIKDEVFEKIMEFFLGVGEEELNQVQDMEAFARQFIPYVEVSQETELQNAATMVLSGTTALFVDGVAGCAIIDVRTYPQRSIEEPEKDKVMRGSRDGFVETLIMNTALVRRRIRDPRLRMEYCQVGEGTKLDVALSFIDGVADRQLLEKLRTRLKQIRAKGLNMTQEALTEALLQTGRLNPFPRIKFTERPDYASACLLDGKVLLIMDNSPAVMILPTSFADFLKEADEYYFPPVTGTYIRLSRVLVSLATLLLTPVFLYLINNPQHLPAWLDFIEISEPVSLPILAQFLILEFVIDGLRLASLNTPTMLSNALGIIGGLLLSEFAVKAEWFTAEAILYMAFVAIANYAQPSFEMGYALKFARMFLLITTQLFGLWGLLGGLALVVLLAACTRTLDDRGYLYPILPFNWKDFRNLFVRTGLKE